MRWVVHQRCAIAMCAWLPVCAIPAPFPERLLYRMVILYIIFVSCLATPFRTVSPIINSCSETEDKFQILEVSRGYTWFIAYIVIK